MTEEVGQTSEHWLSGERQEVAARGEHKEHHNSRRNMHNTMHMYCMSGHMYMYMIMTHFLT